MRVLRNYLPDSGKRVVAYGALTTIVQRYSIPSELRGQTISFRVNVEILKGEMPMSSTFVYNSTKALTESLARTAVVDGVIIAEALYVPNSEDDLQIYSYNNQPGGSAGIEVARWNAHLVIGEKASDIWVPAEADLTPEQIATLPPYGEYKEIKSF